MKSCSVDQKLSKDFLPYSGDDIICEVDHLRRKIISLTLIGENMRYLGNGILTINTSDGFSKQRT